MKQLTPKEFFAGNRPFGKLGASSAIISIPNTELFDLMQAYVEHCEQSAWTSVGESQPEKCGEYWVSLINDSVYPNEYYEISAIYRPNKNEWKSLRGTKIFPEKWRPLPTPPIAG